MIRKPRLWLSRLCILKRANWSKSPRIDNKRRRMRTFMLLSAVVLMAALGACSSGGAPTTGQKTAESPGEALPAGIFVEKRPEGELPLAEAKSKAKTGETIVLRGVIRGVNSA